MITLNGSLGEGGGQILRTALSLSAATSQPFRIEQIRANRAKPGLLRQHLTAVLAAAEISDAQVTGAELHSATLEFTPNKVRPGTYRFAVGTAGSATLVLQTLLPALLLADAPSHLTLEGGTHNPLAPPFDFLDLAFLPLLNRMGANVSATLENPGFYPAGGGKFTVFIQPAGPQNLKPLELLTRGTLTDRVATAHVAGLPKNIAQRELAALRAHLEWPEKSFRIRTYPDRLGPGNALCVEVAHENVTEVVTAFGERGTSAEGVAAKLLAELEPYLKSDIPVGEHLADQFMIPCALAALNGHTSRYRTSPLSEHSRTNLEVIQRFLPVRFECANADASTLVTVRPQ